MLTNLRNNKSTTNGSCRICYSPTLTRQRDLIHRDKPSHFLLHVTIFLSLQVFEFPQTHHFISFQIKKNYVRSSTLQTNQIKCFTFKLPFFIQIFKVWFLICVLRLFIFMFGFRYLIQCHLMIQSIRQLSLFDHCFDCQIRA